MKLYRYLSVFLRVLLVVVITLSIMLQSGCASSKYGQVPCPCNKKSHRR